MTKAEAAVIQLQAKEHQRWPTNHQKLLTGKEGFPTGFKGSVALQNLDFRILPSRAMRQKFVLTPSLFLFY